jgi:hypothetical protein
MTNTTGYSGTPLIKKLGIKDGYRCLFVNQPENYFDLVGLEIPTESPPFDFIHIFETDRSELAKAIEKYKTKIMKSGMIWISWPKKSSKVPTDITEQDIRDICLPMGLVDIKVCAVDETWSGLKLVWRKELRG